MKVKIMIKTALLTLLLAFNTSAFSGTLEDVRSNGYLKCGVSTGLAGFSSVNSSGRWRGVDVDVCRAVAAAVLGDGNKVKFIGLTAKERFTALQSGEIDMLSRNTTWTATRDSALGLTFAGVNYYDGQGFMVKKSLGINKLSELDGATFCIQAGTTTELNLADYFRQFDMSYKSVTVDSSAQSVQGFEAGRCDAITSDQSQLYSLRTSLKNPKGAIVLTEIISKEPLGPVVRNNDPKWFNIVKWSLNAMITAEELGVTSRNVYKNYKNPEVNRLLGRSGSLHKNLGLSKNWAADIIRQVGNYSESFERNIGINTPLKIKRGVNALWKDGGILYSPPFR